MSVVDVPPVRVAGRLKIKRKIQRIPPANGGDNGGNGGDGDGGGGPRLPQMPEGSDLGQFLEFVHDLLRFWTESVAKGGDAFSHLDDDDRGAIKSGWEDFHAQWEEQRSMLIQAMVFLQSDIMSDDMRRRGLKDGAFMMKLRGLGKSFRRFAESLDFTRHWSNLVQSADIIVDSVKEAATSLPLFPGTAAVLSGMKEFKDFTGLITDKGD